MPGAFIGGGSVIGLPSTGGSPKGRGIPRMVIGPLEGFKEAMAQLESLKESIPKQAVEATSKELDKLLIFAKSITPVDYGNLQKSGRVFKPRFRKDATITFQIIFGGIVTTSRGNHDKSRTRLVDYAYEVHEEHPSKGKFLEIAGQRYLPGLADRVASQIKVKV